MISKTVIALLLPLARVIYCLLDYQTRQSELYFNIVKILCVFNFNLIAKGYLSFRLQFMNLLYSWIKGHPESLISFDLGINCREESMVVNRSTCLLPFFRCVWIISSNKKLKNYVKQLYWILILLKDFCFDKGKERIKVRIE